MSRLIDADALHKAYMELRNFKQDPQSGDWISLRAVPLTTVIRLLNEAPTIDAVEVVRGEWVKRTHDTLIAQVNFAYCSECGQPIMHEHTRPLWSFCPNCGCRMKGADDE